jgi:hypothetical protein
MRQFPLLVDGLVRNFDTDGRVLDTAENVVGSWSTTKGNLIRVTKAEGGTTDLAVDWLFNAENQLTIGIGGNVLFTIANAVDGLPRFSLDGNTLIVDPDGDSDFKFRLDCLYGLQPDGNLVVSINGKESVLDGFIEDSKSRFRFQFFDKTLPSFPNSLVFTGQWERKNASSSDKEQILLHFKLATPAEIAGKPLDLPAAVKVDPQRNHFALVYQSTSHGERRLQFQGSMEIKKGWKLVFRIEDVQDGTVRKSVIEVEANFEWDRGHLGLTLNVGKTKTPTSQTIEIGGSLAMTLGNTGQLTWNFAYRKSTAGGTPAVTTIATSFTFVFKQGEIFIEYKQDGQARSFKVTGKVVTGNFALVGGVEIKQDPQGRSVKVFIGISF